MHGKYILSIDAGTTNCKAVIFDSDGKIMGKAENGYMVFGTVDSWILYNLDSSRPQATDYTNASQ